MLKPTLLCAIAIILSSFSYADDPSAAKTILKIYPVGDLVSADAMKTRSLNGKTTSEEWASEYPETIKALDQLQSIVETMCLLKPVAIKTYAPSLSLIVRHTPDGHDEIAQLLRNLGEGNAASVRMECHALYSEFSELKNADHTEAEQGLLRVLLSKPQLTKTETTELLALLPSRPAHKQTVALRSGRRTAWGHVGRPCTSMGRVDRTKRTVQIRLDFISDDYAAATPFGSQVFSLAEGESALFHHYCDGGTVVWLVTTRILTPKK